MESVAQQTGASAGDIAGVLSNIAPLIMSGLSAATTSAQSSQNSGVDLSDGFDLSDVFGMLGGGAPAASQSGTSQGSNGTQLLQTFLGMMK